LLLSLIGNITISNIAVAATQVHAEGTFYYDPWSSDWGTKRQYFTIVYYGDQFEGFEAGSTFQAVELQDFFIYRKSQYYIWPPEIGNGIATLDRIELQTSSGTKTTQTNSNWSTGTYRDYLIDPDSITYTFRKNPFIQAFPGGSYRIKATGTHQMPANTWIPFSSTKSIYTSYF